MKEPLNALAIQKSHYHTHILKYVLFSSLMLAWIKPCSAQVNSKNRLYEILGLLYPPPNFDTEKLLEDRNFKLVRSTTDTLLINKTSINYSYGNPKTGDLYSISYTNNQPYYVSYISTDGDNANNIRNEAVKVGFKYKDKTIQLGTISTDYNLNNIILTFHVSRLNDKTYYHVTAMRSDVYTF